MTIHQKLIKASPKVSVLQKLISNPTEISRRLKHCSKLELHLLSQDKKAHSNTLIELSKVASLAILKELAQGPIGQPLNLARGGLDMSEFYRSMDSNAENNSF
jgi:hypothetical protein